MTQTHSHPTTFVDTDLTGARFQRVQLAESMFRMVDFTGSVMRAVNLAGVAIDVEDMDGLVINGVEVGPLIEAELTRREPARALRRASDPAGLRAAWAAIQQSWESTYERVAAMPAGTADVPVGEEWSFTETLRHLVFVTDSWLGAVLGEPRPYHPWALPFSDLPEFIDIGVADLGIDTDASPSTVEVLEVRRERVARVAAFLDELSQERLDAENAGPIWDTDQLPAARCLRVILNEECEHLRIAQRDLDLIDAGSPLVPARRP